MNTKLILPLLVFAFLAVTMKSEAQWNLTGNSNATATSLLGTTNAFPLNLTTNNVQRMVIDANGKVGIGIAAPPNVFSVKGSGGVPSSVWTNAGAPLFTGFGEQTVGNADYILSIASSLANARPVFIGRKARGTLAAPAVVSNNDQIMSFLSSGFDGTAFQNPAAIDFFVDGTPTAGNVPARISFVTGTNGATRAERLKIGSTGDITVNTNQLFVQSAVGNVGLGTTTPLQRLHVAGSSITTENALVNGAVVIDASNTNDGTLALGGSLRFGNAATGEAIISKRTSGGNQFGIDFLTGAASRLSIANNGNVGIGTTSPNTSALLDINSTSKGILVPRMTTAQKNALPAPANGLLIYQTDSVSGFYYFNTTWLNLTTSTVTSSFANQALSNLTTPTAVNQDLLPGTTNNLSLGSNAQNWKNLFISGSISNGATKIFNADLVNDNLAIGEKTLNNNTSGQLNIAIGTRALEQNTTGLVNTAVGIQALSKNTTGGANTAIGDNALSKNTTGEFNTAIGRLNLSENTTGNGNASLGSDALTKNTIGNNNTGVGSLSLADNGSGNDNTAVGRASLASNIKGSSNTAIGKEALVSNETGFSNVAVGVQSLKKNTNGSNLVAIGDSALFNQNGGVGKNTALGSKALFTNVVGEDNTSVGFNSLKNSVGNGNTAVGSEALLSNSSGSFNTAIGGGAFISNTTGRSNTIIGANSMKKITNGNNNTITGAGAMQEFVNGSGNSGYGAGVFNKAVSGNDNTAIGVNAMKANNGGNSNTAVGVDALSSNLEGYSNAAFGKSALLLNFFGSGNTAIGDSTMFNNNSNGGTALGYQAMFENTTGEANTAIGIFALTKNTTGLGNVGVGVNALANGTTGRFNNGIGSSALKGGLNQSGSLNNAFGGSAILNITSGSSNCAFGDSTMLTNLTGSRNSVFGKNANVSTSNLSNSTAIGNGAVVNASNKMQLGSSTTLLSATGGITIVSDGRFKDNVKADDVPGLAFINNLKPVAYNFNYKNYDDFLRKEIRKQYPNDATDISYQQLLQQKSEVREVGFIAQEVDNLVHDKGYTFNGVYTPQNANDNYALDYSRFVVPLVKAVQELSKKNDELGMINDKLKKAIEQLTMDNGQLKANDTKLQKQIDDLKAMMQQLLNSKSTAPCPPLAGQ